jgi:glyoxylase-like metal-dependent hydrolase (beta-lactamase superfamily II)
VRNSFWLQGMMAGFPASYFCIKAFSVTDTTEDLKKFDVPTLILHGDDDQIVPIGAAAMQSSKIVKGAKAQSLPRRAAWHVHDPEGRSQRRPARLPSRLRIGSLRLRVIAGPSKNEDAMSSLQPPLLSRRHFCFCCIAGAYTAANGWLTPRQAFAEARGIVSLIKDSAAVSPIVTHQLRNNISVLEGSGGNIAVLTGPDGKVLIDAGIGVSRPQITKALAGIGTDPISHLINTHWHFDHADGNEWLHSVGAKIIAQENTRKHLSEVQRVEDWDYNFLPPPPGGIPADVFASERSLKLNGSTISLKHYGSAHTDSDISVSFGEADILHVGDTFWNGIYPFIDYSTGGGIDGMITACDANLAATTDKTIIIPGHGNPVSNRAELKEFGDMLVAIRENVAKLKKQGRSRDEAVAAKPTAAFDAKWGNFVIDPGFFTRLVYAGV